MPNVTRPPKGPSAPPRGSAKSQQDRYQFLIRDESERPWTPLGSTPDERRAHIQERAESLFGSALVEGGHAAAYTFLGQFVAHDLSFDVRTSLEDTGANVPNHRSPRFDLDSIYGAGSQRDPQLYQLADRSKLAIGRNRFGEPDLPRSDDASLDRTATNEEVNLRRRALIADPRNDANVVIAQLHLAFLKFHNRLVDEGHDFAHARRLTRLHYQWVVVHEYLAALCGEELIERVSEANSADRLFPPSRPAFVPFEFSFAAFRFGHSMVGPDYHLSDALQGKRQGFPFRFYVPDATSWRSRDGAAAGTLDGERALPRRWTVQWDRFLAGEGEGAQRAQRIDTSLSEPLRFLPFSASDEIERNLAYRTLTRGWQLKLPTGQRLATRLQATPIPSEHENDDPLWIYILREAEVDAASRPEGEAERLGPVGGRIVTEVFWRLLEEDPHSVANKPDWRPTLAVDGDFTLRDFIAYAGLPISADDWHRVVGEA